MVNNKKVLITGGAGFIGSYIAEYFAANRYKVIVVDNLSSVNSQKFNNNLNIIFYKRDITNDSLDDIFENEMPDIIIHLAAQVSVTKSTKEPIFDAMQNIIGTLKILKYCRKYGVKKIVAASTAAVYGDIKPPVSEDSAPKPLSHYGLSKLTMEEYVKLSGVNYIIIRFSNVYGSRQNVYGEAGVITLFKNAMLKNQEITIFGDGEQVRDFIYVKDIAKIVFELCETDIVNEIVNISTGQGISINNLFKLMAKKYNYSLEPKYKPKRENDIVVSILSNDKLLKILPCHFVDVLKNKEVLHLDDI